MLKLLPFLLVILAAPILAQNKVAGGQATSEFLDTKYWSDLGKPTEGTRGFALFTRNMQPKEEKLFEFWVKILPTNSAVFNKRYGLPKETAYVIQYATVDCSKRFIQLEKTQAYDSLNGTLDARGSELVKNENRSRVKSGSVSEIVYEYTCLRLQ